MFKTTLGLCTLLLLACTPPKKSEYRHVYFSGYGPKQETVACKFTDKKLHIFGQKSQSLSFRFRSCSPSHDGYVFKYRLKNNSDIFVSGREANAPDINGVALQISKLGPYSRDDVIAEIIKASGNDLSQCRINDIDGPNHFIIQPLEPSMRCSDIDPGAVSVRVEIKEGLILMHNMDFNVLFDTQSFIYSNQG